MSYNYNELVSQISKSRQQAMDESTTDDKVTHLQEAVDSFSTLSSHCPMTPLLWMQYSADTAELLQMLSGGDDSSPLTTRLQMLELALAEFPGSAVLHLHYLQLLTRTDETEKMRVALDRAIQNVGQGSHRNEGGLIAAIYRLDASFRAQHETWEAAVQSFLDRAKTPMKDVNQTLATEYHQFCAQHQKVPQPKDVEEMELWRRYESRTYNELSTCEDDVDIAMNTERISSRNHIDLENLDWPLILRSSNNKTFWMGFGGMTTSNAFHRYAQTCYRYRMSHGRGGEHDHEEMQARREAEQLIKSLAPSVYERGVAECPTIESLWLSYIQHLQYLVQNDNKLTSRLKTVVDRSCRNCPYSLALFQQKLKTSLLMADLGLAILDPDELVKMVQEAIGAKFITTPAGCVELYMTAVQVLKRRILSVLAVAVADGKSYDDAESVHTTATVNNEIDDNKKEEIQDLCEDIRDLYDATDTYLRKHHSGWSEGRARVWSDRAFTESMLLTPISSDAGGLEPKAAAEVVQCYEKLTKVHQPCHPDSYSSYIKHFFSNFPISGPISVLSRLRQTRFLYQKALKSVGKPKKATPIPDQPLERDYETALRCLCHDYMVFERYFGSDRSIAHASKNVQKKLAKTAPNGGGIGATVDMSLRATQDTSLDDAMDKEIRDSEVTDKGSGDNDFASKKRQREESESDPPTKKQKTPADEKAQTSTPSVAVDNPKKDKDNSNGDDDDSSQQQHKRHKVKVGNMEYPAHPFTVRVSKLHVNTEDMDLVDGFKKFNCGAIVHARIMRDRHHHHGNDGKLKSKGWGLVQFEEREDVEKALQLSGIIGLHEKLIQIERSHMPAVAIVPPGMHRVSPKGEGKKSKYNQKMREKSGKSEEPDKQNNGPKKSAPTNDPFDKKSSMSVLAFRPRGIHTNRKRKVAAPKKEV